MTDLEERMEMTPREMRDTTRFLESIRMGVGPLNAAIAIGWTPSKLKKLMGDPEFAELVSVSVERRLESSEQVLYELAQGGHFKALQMVLYNERSSKWRDLRHIEVQQATTLDVGVVVSVKASVLELLREQGVAALQAPLDVIDVESSEPSD